MAQQSKSKRDVSRAKSSKSKEKSTQEAIDRLINAFYDYKPNPIALSLDLIKGG